MNLLEYLSCARHFKSINLIFPTPLSPLPSRSLLLPDGKNQLLLALLKCTGEGFERATVCNVHVPGTPGRGCPGSWRS